MGVGTNAVWGPCDGEVIAIPEQCSTADVDEDCNGSTAPCSTAWSFAIGVTDTEQNVRSIAVDADGNVYALGDFRGTVSFGGTPLKAEESVEPKSDIFVAKYDNNGNHLWSKRFGDSSNQYASKIVVDTKNNTDSNDDELILSCRAFGSISFGGENHKSKGSGDIVVAKLDKDGGFKWSRMFGADLTDRGERFAIENDGDIWYTGTFEGTVDFGRGPRTSNGNKDIFVLKLDGQDGLTEQVATFGGPEDDYGFGIGVDDQDNAFVTGFFADTVDFDGQQLTSQGDKDVFVLGLDNTVNVQWAQRLGDTQDDRAFDLVVNGTHVLVTGYFAGTINLDGGNQVTSAGSRDLFLAQFNKDGTSPRIARFGDNTDQVAFETFADNSWNTLDVDSDGNVYLGGSLTGTADFDAILGSAGKMDAFFVKFVPDSSGGDGLAYKPFYSQRFGTGGTEIGLDIAYSPADGRVVVGGRFYSSRIEFGSAGTTLGFVTEEDGSKSGGDGFVAKLPVAD